MTLTNATRIAFICTSLTLLVGCQRPDLPEGCGDGIQVAADPRMRLAMSCALTVEFRGRDYWVDCYAIHPSRVGRPLDAQAADNHEFGPASALRANGFDPKKVFLLKPDPGVNPDELSQPWCEKPHLWIVAEDPDYDPPLPLSRLLLRPHR